MLDKSAIVVIKKCVYIVVVFYLKVGRHLGSTVLDNWCNYRYSEQLGLNIADNLCWIGHQYSSSK